MRTILAGIRSLRRAPLAVIPLAVEGLVGALLVLTGGIPASSAAVPSTAVFPLDVFFDVKQSISFGRSWAYVVAAVGVGVLIRGAVLAGTLWLSDGRPGPFVAAWARAARLTLIAAVALVPSATLFFAGAATRYAPFIWAGALAGVLPAAFLARRAVQLDVGAGEPQGSGVPEIPNFISYAYIVTAFGAAMSVLADDGKWAAALLVACLGPMHALFLVGWREHVRNGSYPGGGTIVTIISILLIAALFSLAAFDRFIRDPAPVRKAPGKGLLIVLGGADTTSKSGALADLDPRTVGYRRSKARQLSYKGAGKAYEKEDTRAPLARSAEIISKQIKTAARPRALLGHSQAALILDRMLDAGLPVPERAVMLAPPPPQPPLVEAPAPGRSGEGSPAADLTRLLSSGFELVGFEPFEIDAPNSPTRLDPVIVKDSDIPRLSVWALGDSVWLEGDWRRPGEVNLIALTDHVGVTDNEVALAAANDFFAGRKVSGDESSWKGVAVGVLKYAFAPWRPR